VERKLQGRPQAHKLSANYQAQLIEGTYLENRMELEF
jgi:hypothetical protein